MPTADHARRPRAAVDEAFADHDRVLKAAVAELSGPLERVAALLVGTYRQGGKASLFGNGGSMTDALHAEGELLGRLGCDRPGLRAVALGGASSRTASANDSSYQDAFARTLVVQARPGDVAVGFATSGNSENVVRALRAARGMKLATLDFAGEGGGKCRELADVCRMVPSQHTPRVQELHTLCDLVERALFPWP